jgi:tetratricopeptide (TPR) repeat protein
MSEVTITYHSPGVKGRRVWGDLVPYHEGTALPWRAGANENTTISFSTDVMIEGKPLPAGTYGLHMLPTPGDWTLIFSTNSTSWGSFTYKKEEDALRVTVKPVAAPHEEWLRYGFENLNQLGATAYLHWEKLKVPFRIELAGGHDSILESFRLQLRGLAGFFSQGYIAAAQYCSNNKVGVDQGLKWADQGIANGGGFNARIVKSQLLVLAGKTAQADSLRKASLEQSNENEMNNYGYQLLNQGKVAEAVEIFRTNVRRFPDSWNVYDSLGEGLGVKGDTKEAITYYQKALEKNPPEAQVQRINQVLQTLQSKL